MSFEKVNPSHPDKVADRIAGALVDLAYKKTENPKIAVEVLIGHGTCHIITETSVHLGDKDVLSIVDRITGVKMTDKPRVAVAYLEVPQDAELAKNQAKEIRCGDNGIFKGIPTNSEEKTLSSYTRMLYEKFPTDGKFIYDEEADKLIICQSNATELQILKETTAGLGHVPQLTINPLGPWTGGINVDTGATNRKLGSDMGRAVTGGGLHGKDLSKADVAVNIFCHDLAQHEHQTVEALCAIGDKDITVRFENGEQYTFAYGVVVDRAGNYIEKLGGFEKLAEWGLI